jgi:hypothetical protein
MVPDVAKGDGMAPTPDGLVADKSVSDQMAPDLLSPDLTLIDGTLTLRGEITSGGILSKGGSYTLISQIGPGLGATPMAGGSYTLSWNTSIIPW